MWRRRRKERKRGRERRRKRRKQFFPTPDSSGRGAGWEGVRDDPGPEFAGTTGPAPWCQVPPWLERAASVTERARWVSLDPQSSPEQPVLGMWE